jgi:D-amino peptidase
MDISNSKSNKISNGVKNMKVYISVDMEGVAGVVEPAQTDFKGKDYDKARKWLTGEVNAVIDAALECGAETIMVNDSHGDMCNILIDELNPKVTIISGHHKPMVMMEGIEKGFDAVVFVGYHGRMGTQGAVIDHTMWGRIISEFRINNRLFGETGINALVAGYYKTPVVLVCGDDKTVKEARQFLGRVETVAVKRGITRYCAESLHPEEAQRRIKEAAQRAFSNLKQFTPFTLPKPCLRRRFRAGRPLKLCLRFTNTGMADEASIIPGVRRTDAIHIEYKARNILELYNMASVMIMMAATTISA